ncbi:hypothetical protein, partial [Microcoleus sp.]|uniref:hypothetical protein n=1 Tax=Microcoleus sp. TaxID=44472 RepID=UPI003525A3DD
MLSKRSEAEPLDIGSQAEPGNQLSIACSQALPGNTDPEALPPLLLSKRSEAEPLDIGSQAEPGNQLS